ncbi:MAG: hypothetical protein JW768_04100 [Chitinispirillaceae bacterium]|nr:hypothetical protein [Chitinispirillaceae bacterium]
MEIASSTSPCSFSGAQGAAAGQGTSGTGSNQELSEEDKREVKELKKRDKEVRAHEAAHVAVGGQYVRGGAQFEYEVGPDGHRYAVGGEVSIDTSPVPGDSQATIRKMQVVKAAALAPADPSAQDRAIAAKASMQASKARAEQIEEQRSEAEAQTAGGIKGFDPKNSLINDSPFSKPATVSYTNDGSLIKPSSSSASAAVSNFIDMLI